MNLLFVTPDFLPNKGGIANMTQQLADSMGEGFANVFILAPGQRHASDVTGLYSVLRDSNARPSIMSGPEWESSEKPRVLEKLAEVIESHKIDRIICMHPHYYGQALVALKENNRLAGYNMPPFDSVYHGLELLSCFSWPKVKQSFVQKYVQRVPSHRDAIFQTVTASEFVFCNSRYTQSLVSKIDRGARPVVIGCGIPRSLLDHYADVSGERRALRRLNARQKIRLPTDAMIVGYVGRLVVHKNVEQILKLVARSPLNTHALIGGDGPEKQILEAKAAKLGVSSRVHFRRLETDALKMLAFESLDQFALLSKKTSQGGIEGFGIVLLEAMATGIPVISSGTGGTRDVFEDRVSGRYVNLKVPGHLRRISRELNVQKSETDSLIVSAQSRVRDMFTWEHVRGRIIAAWSDDLLEE